MESPADCSMFSAMNRHSTSSIVVSSHLAVGETVILLHPLRSFDGTPS